MNHECLHWTFEKIIIGLYDRFVQLSTMQDAQKEFLNATYSAATGIQEYYDILMDHAQNMVIRPDEYQVMDWFLHGILEDIRDEVFKCGLSPEVNTIDDLMACTKAIEISKKMAVHYCKKNNVVTTASPKVVSHRTTTNTKPKQAMYVCCPQMDYKPKDSKKDNEDRHHLLQTPAKMRGETTQAYNQKKDNRWSRHQYLPKTSEDKHKQAQLASDACFNCGKVGHFAADCPRPKQSRDQIQAVRTEVPEEIQEPDYEVGEDRNQSSHQEDGYASQESYHGDDIEEVKVDIYDNDYYSRETDKDIMAAMTDVPAEKIQSDK